jgi:hypothetical protein
MPLVVAAGLAAVIWSAWPSSVHERGEHQPGYVASDGQPAAQPGQQAPAAGQPSEAVPRREPDPLMANAPLASEPVQGAALVEGSGELAPAEQVDPASGGAVGEGLDALSGLDADPLGAAEPEGNTMPQLAPSTQGSRAKRAAREDTPAALEDTLDEQVEPRPTASAYEPVRAVPLQPLLDRIDRMLEEPPASAPSAAPPAAAPSGEKPSAPPRRRQAESLPDNPY